MNLTALHTDYTASKLITKGNFLPSTSNNSRLQEFQSYKKGMMLCVGLDNYRGEYFTMAQPNRVAPPSVASGLNFNTDTWAATANGSGCKYCVFTIFSEYSWALWETEARWPLPTQSITNTSFTAGFTSPTFRKYDVNGNGTINRNLVRQWVNSMRKVGIEPIPYFDVSDSFNFIGGNIGRVSASMVTTWINYVAMLLQEVIIKYKLRYVWLDNYQGIGNTNMQIIYNAVKSVSTDCLVIASQNNGGFGSGFPCDIVTVEEYKLGTNSATLLANNRTFGGVTYYTPTEVVSTTLTNEQYYFMDTLIPVANKPTTWTNSPRTQAEIQTNFTTYRGYGANYLMSVTPDQAGNISSGQTDLIKNLV